MPTYAYDCPDHGEMNITKPMSECSNKEYCPDCGSLMNKIWTAPNVSCDRTFENLDAASYKMHLINKKDIEKNRNHVKHVDIPKGMPAELRPNV